MNSLPDLLFLVSTMLWLHTVVSAETRSTYIIHTDKSHMPEPFTSHHHWHSSILDSLVDQKSTQQQQQQQPSIIYSYGTVLHGFSASLTPAELESLKKTRGFVSAFRDKTGRLETTRTPEFLGLSPSAGIWPATNFGEDAVIGVVDTGVWPESESFNDRGMSPNIPPKWKGICQQGQGFNSSVCNRKLIGARYFNKGVIADGGAIDVDSARDTDGHGTHTAATAAGSPSRGASYFGYAAGTARGTAPRARVAVYKVSWTGGGMFASDVIAGMDKAVEDGVDVLSVSLSFRRGPLHEDPLAIAAFGAAERGVVVVAAAGNGDRNEERLRNGTPWAVTVGAGSVDRSLGGTVRLGNGVSVRGWSLFPAGAIVENVKVVYNRTLSACNSSDLISAAGDHPGDRFIIVCDGTLPELQNQFSTVLDSQMSNVLNAQVVGAILISNESLVLESEKFAFPGLVISPKDGPTVIRYAQSTESPVATIKFQQTFLGTKPAPAVATYSLEGPAHANPFVLKPDIMAPGTWVLAAWVPGVETATIGTNVAISSPYNILHGTSMATPHVSGVAALLKSAHPDWSPAAVKSAMMTTADPLDNTRSPIPDNYGDNSLPATPLAMGSGHVDPNLALDPGLVYDLAPQDYVSFMCALNFTAEELAAVTRSKANDCSRPSLDLNYPAFMANCESADASGVVKFARVVTNVGDGPATYGVSVKTPESSTVRVSPRKLVFKKKNEKRSYEVTVRCEKNDSGSRTFGELVWVEANGKRRVRSPIVVTP